MEAISTFPCAHQPIRSISLPTRVHPSSQRVEALLNHLKTHHFQSQNGLEAHTIQSDLVMLAEFYNSVEELLNSPHSKQGLLHYQRGKLVEDALCGTLTLLDACGAIRDLLLALKEHVQSLQSAIRRRKCDSRIEVSICAYERFRKKVKKEIAKQIGAMKRIENKDHSFSQLGQDQCVTFLARVISEARTITISIFRSLLLFLSMPWVRTKGPSLISKLKSTLFSIEKEHKDCTNEVAYLNALRVNNSDSKVEVQDALRMLETLNVGIDGLEGALDCIFRCLVQNRVLFLNMLVH